MGTLDELCFGMLGMAKKLDFLLDFLHVGSVVEEDTSCLTKPLKKEMFSLNKCDCKKDGKYSVSRSILSSDLTALNMDSL